MVGDIKLTLTVAQHESQRLRQGRSRNGSCLTLPEQHQHCVAFPRCDDNPIFSNHTGPLAHNVDNSSVVQHGQDVRFRQGDRHH